MIYMHLIGLLTFEILTLIAAIYLAIYVHKQGLSKWYRYAGRTIVIMLTVIILSTFAHLVAHHFHNGHNKDFHHKELYEKHHKHQEHHDHNKHHGEERRH